MKLFIGFLLIFTTGFSSTLFGMKLTPKETKQIRSCLKAAQDQCANQKDKNTCMMNVHKNLDPVCQKIYKKSSTQMAHAGSSCLGLFKICPMSYGASADDFQKFEACVKKNINKVPKSCQHMMTQMYKGNTGKEISFQEMIKKGQEKNSAKGVQVKNK